MEEKRHHTTAVHVVRHGVVHNPTGVIYGRLPDFHLSDVGHQMAKISAESLMDNDIAAVISSPLERAMETAEPFATDVGEVATDERLIEAKVRFEGQRFSIGDGALRHPRSWWWLRNPFRPSWGEAYRDIAARMRAAVFAAAERGVGREVVCISHQLPIEVLRRDVLGERLWHDPRNRMVTLASITSFTITDGAIVQVRYAEPALDLVPEKLRARRVRHLMEVSS